MLPVRRVVILPLRLVLNVVMLPPSAVDERAVNKSDAHTTYCKRFIVFLLVNKMFTGLVGCSVDSFRGQFRVPDFLIFDERYFNGCAKDAVLR